MSQTKLLASLKCALINCNNKISSCNGGAKYLTWKFGNFCRLREYVWLYLVGYIEVYMCGVCVCVCVCMCITCMYMRISRNRRIQLIQDVLLSFCVRFKQNTLTRAACNLKHARHCVVNRQYFCALNLLS